MALEADQNGQKVKLLFRRLSLGRSKGKRTVLFFTGDIAYTVRIKE